MKIQVEIIVLNRDFLTGSLSFLPHPIPVLSLTASLVQANSRLDFSLAPICNHGVPSVIAAIVDPNRF